jgi:thiopurine S-methyltransferase
MNEKVLEGPMDCVFDRGSYVAIERDDRKKYVQLMLSMMSSKFRYLLAAVEYDPTRFEGPPRHVDKEEVTEYFTKSGTILIES